MLKRDVLCIIEAEYSIEKKCTNTNQFAYNSLPKQTWYTF